MRLIRVVFAAALSVSAYTARAQTSTAGATVPAPPPPSRAGLTGTVDSLAAAFIAEPQAPGVSIAVIRASRDTLVFKGYGRSDIENDVPATPATVYRIGSITKQFTAAAVMRLVERGTVHLDDPIGKYLGALPAAWRPVTVQELLNHTSGIPSYTDLGESWIRRWGESMPPDTLVALTAHKPLDFAPGTNWRYDNSGYVVLGMLLEKVTGSPYAAYLDSTLFRPLGLTGTRYCYPAPIIPHRSRGYARAGQTFTNATFLNMTQPFSAGALCSTVGDLARWNAALATGQVVSPTSYRQMTTPRGAAVSHHYGFGLERDTLGGRVRISHGGGINGFITSNAYFPSDSLSITVLANAAPSDPERLANNIARAVFGLPLVHPPTQPQAVPLPSIVRDAIPGRYVLQVGQRELSLTVRADSTGVTAQAAGQGAFPLTYEGNDTFGTAVDPTIHMRFVIENDHALRIVFTQNGQSFDGRRTP